MANPPLKSSSANEDKKNNPIVKGLKHLSDLNLLSLISKHPNFPINYIPKAKFNDKTANGLTHCIISFIQLSNYQAERISNTGRLITSYKKIETSLGTLTEKSRWIKGTGTNGTADISATIKGRSVKIEVKIGPDKQSEAQKEYQKNIEQAGGIYIIAKDFEGFYQWYNDFMKGTKVG